MAARKVYVVDDDPGVLKSTVFLLRSAGHDCEAFAGAESLLAAVVDLHPGIVVTDLRMPGMNGFELRQALEDAAIGWPMVLMTSDDSTENRRSAAECGFASYLPKPFAADELLAAVGKCPALPSESGD